MPAFEPGNRCVVHIDADAFFASVEQRDNPELKGKPVIIGHDPQSRGVVSTCSYEARAYGVRSAMPVFQAYRLCPNGIFVKPRMKRYQEVSGAMFDIFEKYSPVIEKLSIDEAFIDSTGENGVAMASSIRRHVKQELGITVSAGVSYCKYLAKLASDSCKPDGLKRIAKGEAQGFLDRLPVSCLPGIGPKTQSRLDSLGISTVGALRQMPENWFARVFGKTARRFQNMCNGIDNDPVIPWREVKSISEETTFDKDIADTDSLRGHLAALAQNVAFRLRKAQLKCRTVGVKIRFSDFSTITREHTMPEPVSSDAEIFSQAKTLLEAAVPEKPVRLLGVIAKGLVPKNTRQASLFEPPDVPWDNISQSMDLLRSKYGRPVVFLGASLGSQAGGKTE
ncbi:MAG TPA: DNA polymerase IV [Firmicutes bacterium]|nr:DNA polymerase IV [Candidatus Fermentithermobacillaceae bacterium]